MKEQEELIFQLEDKVLKTTEEFNFFRATLIDVKDKNDELNVQMQKSIEITTELKKKIGDISGDKGNMQSIVLKTGSDVNILNKKLKILEN